MGSRQLLHQNKSIERDDFLTRTSERETGSRCIDSAQTRDQLNYQHLRESLVIVSLNQFASPLRISSVQCKRRVKPSGSCNIRKQIQFRGAS